MLKHILLVSAVACGLFAQWPAYPSKKVPLKDGKADPFAPAPRTAWNTPDFSGLWENARGAPAAPQGKGKAAPDAKGKAAVEAKGKAPADAKGKAAPLPAFSAGPPVASFANIAAGIQGGPPLRQWAKDLLAQRRAGNSKDNPDAHCLPMGLMQFHTHPQPRKIVQTQDMLLIIYEANSGLRQIFLDGRKLPGAEADPWWYGYSVGHWEGNELVVETVRMKDMQWLDIWGTPLTEDGKMIERFRRTNFGTLEIDVTVVDEKTYTEPYTVRVNQRIMPNEELIEFICAENEKFEEYLTKAATKGQ